MELRELLKRMVNSYFVIYGCSMLGTLLFCVIFDPEVAFDVQYLEWMLLFSALGDLPALVFYSGKELTLKQWRVREIIHFVVLEIVLLVAANCQEMYETFWQGVVFAGIILLVYVLVRAVCFAGDFETARNINDQLKEIRKRKEEQV